MLLTEFTNNFSQEIWQQKYCFNDKDINDTFLRTAKDLASVEKDKEYWTDQFLSILHNFKFVPGGRILSNAGTGLTGTTYINCFVHGFKGYDKDSIEGIYTALLNQALILKSEGGYGFCADVMRPRGCNIGGIGNQSPGAVKFLELWDKSSEIITAGSGKKSKKNEKNFIRKGAQMVTLSCWHPDVIEFIEAKKTKDKLSKFNMSVLFTDEFMNCVLENKPWNLIFPNINKYKKEYKKHWNGNIKEWINLIDEDDSVEVYHTFEDANELWDLVMINCYNRNEPGAQFTDTINRLNNLLYVEYIQSSNPCGEQQLPIDGACLLGSLNLTQFVDFENNNWNYEELERVIPIAVRFMDNVNDRTKVPLKSQKEELQNKRRIGLGVLGYGSALMMLKVRYGSKKALKLTKELMEFKANAEYKASVELAREKGSFPLFDKDKYCKSEFIKSALSEDTQKLIKKYGIRNSHLSSLQPTGNTGIVANLVSGGLEPSFSIPGYYRTSIQPIAPDGLDIPKNINWEDQTFDSDYSWKWVKEGDEHLLSCKFNDKVWKYDRNRGLLKEEWIEDYAVSVLKSREEWDENAEWACSAMDLNVDDHVKTMEIFAKYIDSAISKTLNIPKDYDYEDFKNVYINAWKSGIKGFTVYREGTMASVLSRESTAIEQDRPKEVECDVYKVTVAGKPYFVLLGKVNNKLYEIFAGLDGFISNKIKTGKIIKQGKYYKAILDDETEISPLGNTGQSEQDAITRMVSLSFQAGVNLQKIIKQLEKVQGDINSFCKCISRALKRYIKDEIKAEEKCPDCDQPLLASEGCLKCISCAYSKCG